MAIPIGNSFSSDNTVDGRWYTGTSSDPDAQADLSDAPANRDSQPLSDSKQDILHRAYKRSRLGPGLALTTD
jgi:hypothetical protein